MTPSRFACRTSQQFRMFVGIPSGPDKGGKQIEVRPVHYLVSGEEESEISYSCFGDGEPARLRRDHFALLTDDSKAWIVQIEGISLTPESVKHPIGVMGQQKRPMARNDMRRSR